MALRRAVSIIISSPGPKGEAESSDEAMFSLDGTHLSVSDAKLSSLPSFLAKRHRGRPILEFVTSIDCSVNRISNLENVCEFTKLTRLIASHNKLEATAFDGLPIFPKLDTLNLNHNNVSEIGHLIPQLAKVCPGLKNLTLHGNPGVPNALNEENKEQYQQHRYYVISRMSKLENLDNEVVTAAERKYVASKKNSDFSPVAIGGMGVLASLNKDTVGFQVVKEGEMMILDEEEEYVTWDPIYAKLGEGKLLLFNAVNHARPEAIVNLVGYEVSVVEDPKMLAKIGAELELVELIYQKSVSGSDGSGQVGAVGQVAAQQQQKPKIMIVLKDKLALQEWMPLLVSESADKLSGDWDEIERQQTRMRELQENLAEKSTQIRLKRALDQSYAIDANEIKLIKVLGHGGFGTVYLAMVRGKSVACKVFHNQNLTAEALDDFCNEMEILAKIHHPHIINFIGACLEPLMIVTELMSAGDLEKLLLDRSASPLSLLTRLQMAKDAALGMAWLHGSDPMVLHRDVKTANFLVDENLRVVVADFGLSDKLRKGSSTWDDNGYKGTIYFTSPEVLKNAVFNEKSDVYSFGIVLWQILTRLEIYPEFKKVKSNELEKAIFDTVVFKNVRPEIPDDCPPVFKALIEDCWAANADQRPAFSQIVDRIDECIYHESIPNSKARDLWLEWFPGRQQVRWKAFWEHFILACDPSYATDASRRSKISISSSSGSGDITQSPNDLLKTPTKPTHHHHDRSDESSPSGGGLVRDDSFRSVSTSPMFDDMGLKLLIHELLSPNQDMVLHQVNSDVVHIDQWGNFAQWFGPIGYRNHNPAKYAQSIAQNKFFFGQLSINQAFNLLNGQSPGTFLVRYSLSRRGDYSTSFVTPSGSIAHQHIDRRVTIDESPSARKPVKISYVIPSTGVAYDSLFDLIDDQPYLRNRCTGWPFAWIFANRICASDIEDSFLDTAQELKTIRSPRKL